MTTENLAILFTDIVGSTELSQRLAGGADDVRRSTSPSYGKPSPSSVAPR